MNKKILTTAFLVLMAQLAFAVGEENQVLLFTFNYSPKEWSLENAFRTPGVFGGGLSEGRFLGKTISFTGEELFSFKFDLQNEIVVGEVGVIKEETGQHTLILPYFKDAEKIVVTSPSGEVLLEAPVGFLAQTCGNGTCEKHESFGDCPTDCSASGKDNYCNTEQENGCDPDCNPPWLDLDCNKKLAASVKAQGKVPILANINLPQPKKTDKGLLSDYNTLLIAALTLLAVTVVVLFFLKKQKNKKKIYS